MPNKLILYMLVALGLIGSSFCFGQDKPVEFETIPPGAQVQVDGSMVCTTPCSIQVAKEYFGGKYFLFSKHTNKPITVRLLKAGCDPKSVNITTGLRWRNGVGIGMFTYYEVTSPHFQIRLDRPESQNGLASPAGGDTCSEADSVALRNMLEGSRAAIVSIAAGKQHVRGFLISSDGLILTDGAKLIDHRSATVTFSDGTAIKTSKLYYDEDRGMMLLKVQRSGLPWLRLSKSLPQAGEDVFTIGQAVGPGAAQSGDMTRAVVAWTATSDLGAWVLPDRDLTADDPGAPLLNREGQVVGIRTHRDSSLSKYYDFWGAGRLEHAPWIASPDMQSFVDLHFKIVISNGNQVPPRP